MTNFKEEFKVQLNYGSQKYFIVFSVGQGYAALIAGGILDNVTTINTVRLYTPEGGCIWQLSDIPKLLAEPILVMLLNEIYLCFGYYPGATYSTTQKNQNCWKYDFSSRQWLAMASSKNVQYGNGGIVYQNKLYMISDQKNMSEVYDPATNTWAFWDMTYIGSAIGESPCVVQWRDAFFVIGGTSNSKLIRMYNFTTNVWTTLQYLVKSHYHFGCIILPQNPNLILTLSTTPSSPDQNRADIYNIATNTWTQTGSTANNRAGVRLVALGKRVFAIGSYPNGVEVEEFNYQNKTWSKASKLLPESRSYAGLVSVPAALFNDFTCTGVF